MGEGDETGNSEIHAAANPFTLIGMFYISYFERSNLVIKTRVLNNRDCKCIGLGLDLLKIMLFIASLVGGAP